MIDNIPDLIAEVIPTYSPTPTGNMTYPNRANRANRLDLPKSTLKMAMKWRKRVESVQSTVLLKEPCIKSPIKVIIFS